MYKLCVIFFGLLVISSCNTEATKNINTVAIKYDTVVIGKQTWLKENLNVSKFSNGDVISEAKTNDEWIKYWQIGEPAWCYYENKPENEKKYGKLYNRHAVDDKRRLAPEGYHIPTNAEWKVLIDYLGGANVAGGKMKEVGIKHWVTEKVDSTFTALPGGFRVENGEFYSVGYIGYWWTSESSEEKQKWLAYYNRNYSGTGGFVPVAMNVVSLSDNDALSSKYFESGSGLSVRCLKNK
ncbi:MAG: fibrobacter succinogenes major paralogous domain-containing protein [Bacteroidia bacterium]|nr:fibrobacter succinogenes major paralogous domain-containing protein [Bacteroidia bacterium]